MDTQWVFLLYAALRHSLVTALNTSIVLGHPGFWYVMTIYMN